MSGNGPSVARNGANECGEAIAAAKRSAVMQPASTLDESRARRETDEQIQTELIDLAAPDVGDPRLGDAEHFRSLV